MKQLSFGKNPQHRVIPQYCHKLLSNSISLLHSHEITQGSGSLLNRFSQPLYPWKPLKRLCRYCKLSVTKCGPGWLPDPQIQAGIWLLQYPHIQPNRPIISHCHCYLHPLSFRNIPHSGVIWCIYYICVQHTHIQGVLRGTPPVTKVPAIYIYYCHLSCLLARLLCHSVKHFLVFGVKPKRLKQ